MDDTTKRLIDTFEKDFHELSSKGAWTSEDLVKMKDLQKIMYYLEVRCAMKEGNEYPGSEYMDGGSSFRGRGRSGNSYGGNSYGGSYDNSYGGNSYDHPYYDGRGNRGGGGGSGNRSSNMSGRRYYDGEREKFMNELNRMMDSEQDPRTREAMENLARMIEMR